MISCMLEFYKVHSYTVRTRVLSLRSLGFSPCVPSPVDKAPSFLYILEFQFNPHGVSSKEKYF